jgi:hypothetical protein
VAAVNRLVPLLALTGVAHAEEPEPLYSPTTAVAAVASTQGAIWVYAYDAWFHDATRTTEVVTSSSELRT